MPNVDEASEVTARAGSIPGLLYVDTAERERTECAEMAAEAHRIADGGAVQEGKVAAGPRALDVDVRERKLDGDSCHLAKPPDHVPVRNGGGRIGEVHAAPPETGGGQSLRDAVHDDRLQLSNVPVERNPDALPAAGGHVHTVYGGPIADIAHRHAVPAREKRGEREGPVFAG
jgi:hypothetical protein